MEEEQCPGLLHSSVSSCGAAVSALQPNKCDHGDKIKFSSKFLFYCISYKH